MGPQYLTDLSSIAVVVGGAVTFVGGVVGIVAFVPTTLGYFEARKQRLLAERSLSLSGSASVAKGGQSNRVWRCGIYDYPPLSSWHGGPRAEPTGPLVRLGREIGDALGKPVKFEHFSYDRFYMGDERLPDFVVGMFETRKRSERMLFSRSIYEVGLQGICRKNQGGDLLKELREGHLKVAVYKGEVGWEFLHDELPDAVMTQRYVEVAGGTQMDAMIYLKEGAYDVVLMDSLSCFKFLSQEDNKHRFRLAFAEPLQKYRTCVALNKTHAEMLGELNEALVQIRNSKPYLEAEGIALEGYENIVERRGLRTA
jgi:ABC-type amino acid transport substrate-binding protein